MEITSQYATNVDFSGFTITDDDYNKITQYLNVKQNELQAFPYCWSIV